MAFSSSGDSKGEMAESMAKKWEEIKKMEIEEGLMPDEEVSTDIIVKPYKKTRKKHTKLAKTDVELEIKTFGYNECDIVPIKKKGKYGYKNNIYGEIVMPFIYDYADIFKEGLSVVKMDGKWYFINKMGQVMLNCGYRYSEVFNFNEGFALVYKNKNKWRKRKCGFIDKTGQEVIPCIYDYCYEFECGLAIVVRDRKYGVVDKTGQEVIPCVYDRICILSSGKMLAYKNGEYFYIDKKGNRIK